MSEQHERARRPLRYISLFSGMEAATAAFLRAEIAAVPLAFAEIDPAASSFFGTSGRRRRTMEMSRSSIGPDTEERWTSSSEEVPAKALASLESAWGSTTQEAISPSNFSEFSRKPKRLGFATRMSRGYFPLDAASISQPFSIKWENSGIALRGESWTRVSSESHSAAGACSLSDVLEMTGKHLTAFYLSRRARDVSIR